MKPLIVVSVFSMAAFLGLPAGAQTAFPSPYAPPIPPQQQIPRVQEAPPEGAVPEVEDPGIEGQPVNEAAPADEQQPPPAYDPNSNPALPGVADPNAANYPPVDVGPDNEIAQSYDDGYDSQAYTQFQTALAPYGAWDYDNSYGYVWSPNTSIVGAGFAPYANNGHWVMSEYGWTWVSDWNWGWAPFHYGRWITRAGRGWSWVPGTMWGPAWVSWRSGNGYVGWSPLPPRGLRLTAAYGAGSPWRFTRAASLGALHPTFYSSRYLPGLFARTTVVSNDRLLSHGRWNVHVNAGPSRGVPNRVAPLSTIAPRVLPRVAVYPHAGLSLSERPWTHTAARNDVLNNGGWHAGITNAQPHAFGRAPAASPAARPEIRGAVGGWSRPAPAYGNAGNYGHPYGNAWTAPATRPSYGAPMGYGAAAPAYRPAYQSQPAYHAPAAAYHAAAPAYTPAYRPAPRSFSPPAGGGGFSHGGGGFQSGGGSHFGGFSSGGGSHFGGGGGGRRR